MSSSLRRLAAVVGLTLGLVVVLAAPAGADPANPTNDTSRVTSIEPAAAAGAVRVDIVGGDAFLRLRVEPGHEVTVLGYSQEPYLRVLADGTVDENRLSPAVALNQSRYGTGSDLGTADAEAEPQWSRVGGGGSFVWHDHRVHWMVKTPPPRLAGASSGLIDPWSVDLVVDGAPVVVNGELFRHSAPSLTPVALGVVVSALVVFGLGWWSPRRGTGLALFVVSALGVATSLVAVLGIPPETGRRWSMVIIPVLAAACALYSVVVPRSRFSPTLLVASVLVLPLWIGLRWSVVTHAVLPTSSASALQRVAVVLALGALLGALATGARTALAAANRGPGTAPVSPPAPAAG